MQKIEFEFINTKKVVVTHPTDVYAKSEKPMTAMLSDRHCAVGKDETDEDAIERVWIYMQKPHSGLTPRWTDLPAEVLKNSMSVVEMAKPTSFPRFSNEKPFTAYNRSYINPEILAIRWDGIKQTWEYRMKNVGHVYDYCEEKHLHET